ncbi:hypothetical protein SteCoe_19656 [Stentor coeruleus]|uniref:J domain-containing protein n=1 Tax=Stentor coeruleus TaxID=5963 RepID=A0A1R2BTS8_9CILI|nr:hypothetical protein SteCoe_19656 [Stentor coeruleus]
MRKAFLKKAKEMHPDVQTGSEERFKELVKAYQTLKDGRVKEYDEENHINFRDLTKNYARPAEQQRPRQKPESEFTQNNEANRKSKPVGLFVLMGSGFLYLYSLGMYEDSSKASVLDIEYKRNNGKIEYKLYKQVIDKKEQIRF